MASPMFPDNGNAITRDEAVNQIISSIAMEELGLSHIINAEGEKLQYALGTIPGKSGPTEPLSMDDLLRLNESIRKTLDGAMMNQFFLKEKLLDALSSSVLEGPTGPTGPQGPATIAVDPEVESLEPDQPPYVNNDQGTPEDVVLKFGIPRGVTGAVGTILGSYETIEDLRNDIPVGNQGDTYLVGGQLYVWNTDLGEWENVGDLRGPQGVGTTIKGTASSAAELELLYPDGPPEDAYLVDGEIYIWNETDGWISGGSLVGPQGIGTTIKGEAISKEQLDQDYPDGPVEDAYLIDGELFIWNATELWHSAGSLRGPAWAPDQPLFEITGTTGAQAQAVGYEGSLSFQSDTLDIAVEPGPTVVIEAPRGIGTIIPFASGVNQILNAPIFSGHRSNVALIGFGASAVADAGQNDPVQVIVGELSGHQFAFMMPVDGRITAMSAFVTTVGFSSLAGVDSRLSAKIYYSIADNVNYNLLDASAVLEFQFSGAIASLTTRRMSRELSIEVAAGTRLMLIFDYDSYPYTGGVLLNGHYGGSIRIE